MSDEEIERIARKSGLLECIDDAYLARGDWLPEAREFASLLQSAELELVEAEQEAKKTAEWRRFAERLELIRLQCSGMYYWQLDEVLCAIEELLAKWAGEQ